MPPFQRHVRCQVHELFSNLLMQGPCHRPPCRSSFPHHQINQEPLCLFITTKTFANIFSFVIDSVTLHHADSPHLQHKSTILHELDSMIPDAFQAELHAYVSHQNVVAVTATVIWRVALYSERPEAVEETL